MKQRFGITRSIFVAKMIEVKCIKCGRTYLVMAESVEKPDEFLCAMHRDDQDLERLYNEGF